MNLKFRKFGVQFWIANLRIISEVQSSVQLFGRFEPSSFVFGTQPRVQLVSNFRIPKFVMFEVGNFLVRSKPNSNLC